MSDDATLQALIDLVRRLRGPGGCPWDRQQTAADLRAYLLEEAHEVAAALDAADWEEVEEELGDLLFQIVFLAELAAEAGESSLARVIERVSAKMIARHPHVFGGEPLATAAEVVASWERRKDRGPSGRTSLLAGLPASMPALLTSYRMGQKAAGVGFDWPDASAVLAKVDEELLELRQAQAARSAAVADADGAARVSEEIGDLLFTLANLARHLGIDPEAALAQANRKFRRRFERIEQGAAGDGRRVSDLSQDEMETLWREAKASQS